MMLARPRDPLGLLALRTCVLFDFDGPVCGLFAHHPAPAVAVRVAEEFVRLGGHPDVVADALAGGDPLAVLQAAGARHPGSALLRDLERTLTAQETEAAAKAEPTAYVIELMASLDAAGVRVAVTTNNSPDAVRTFFAGHRPAAVLAEHIHGRTADPRLLKPDPDCLRRALASTGTPPHRAVMIGDSVADRVAARAAGVAFLGYAVDEDRRRALEAAGPEPLLSVSSLKELVDVWRPSGHSADTGATSIPGITVTGSAV